MFKYLDEKDVHGVLSNVFCFEQCVLLLLDSMSLHIEVQMLASLFQFGSKRA